MIATQEHIDWLTLREKSKDEYGEGLCYCGHTFKCSCGDPDMKTFSEAVDRGAIIIGDERNGWKELKESGVRDTE